MNLSVLEKNRSQGCCCKSNDGANGFFVCYWNLTLNHLWAPNTLAKQCKGPIQEQRVRWTRGRFRGTGRDSRKTNRENPSAAEPGLQWASPRGCWYSHLPAKATSTPVSHLPWLFFHSVFSEENTSLPGSSTHISHFGCTHGKALDTFCSVGSRAALSPQE